MYNSLPGWSMGQAFKNFILALALPTFINAQCLPPATTSQPTQPPSPTDAPPFGRTAECPPNQCWEGGCDINPNICQITCKTGEACETECADDPQLDVADMNADKCSELCIASRDKAENDKPCRFWRYVSHF